MSVPLSDTELAEIRNLGFLDGAITEFDRSSAAVAATRTLVREVDRLRAELAEYERTVAYFDEQSKRRKTERDEARAQVLAASTVKCWTNEDGRRFVFAEDLAFALGYTPTAPAPAPAPSCGVLNPKVAATCTEPNDHSSPIHRDAFGNTWTRREGERPLSIPTT